MLGTTRYCGRKVTAQEISGLNDKPPLINYQGLLESDTDEKAFIFSSFIVLYQHIGYGTIGKDYRFLKTADKAA